MSPTPTHPHPRQCPAAPPKEQAAHRRQSWCRSRAPRTVPSECRCPAVLARAPDPPPLHTGLSGRRVRAAVALTPAATGGQRRRSTAEQGACRRAGGQAGVCAVRRAGKAGGYAGVCTGAQTAVRVCRRAGRGSVCAPCSSRAASRRVNAVLAGIMILYYSCLQDCCLKRRWGHSSPSLTTC